jgi:hypothetical protein
MDKAKMGVCQKKSGGTVATYTRRLYGILIYAADRVGDRWQGQYMQYMFPSDSNFVRP